MRLICGVISRRMMSKGVIDQRSRMFQQDFDRMLVDNEECRQNTWTHVLHIKVFVLETADAIEWPGVECAERRGVPGTLQFCWKSKRVIQILQGRQCR